MGIALSVVIPAFDEAERIGPTLAAVRAYLEAQGVAAEIIVVDDGSRDGTAARAEAALSGFAASRIIRLPGNLGKGAAVKAGVLEARGDLVLFSDADLSTPDRGDRKTPSLRSKAEPTSSSARGRFPARTSRSGSGRSGKGWENSSTGSSGCLVLKGVPDTQCGFKLFRRDAARAVFAESRIRGFCFDVEILALCVQARISRPAGPGRWRNSPPSRVRLVRSSLGMIADLVRIRRRLGRGCVIAADALPYFTTRAVKGAT